MERDFYAVREIGARMGVTPTRIYQLIAEGSLPACEVGGRIRIPAKAYDEWLDEQGARAREQQLARQGTGR